MYELTIGLEIHLKIKSATKLFCQCANKQNFDEDKPNTNVCPVCTGQPGALPVLSWEPFLQSLRFGKALGMQIQPTSQFDRKSYFYPDLPMGYQITQYFHPTMINGSVTFFMDHYTKEKTVHITAAQIETDTGKTIHHMGKAMIDFNRSATPLVEVVTAPDFSDPEEVVEFLKELQRIARYNTISDADMEKGQMRVDVNISLKKPGAEKRGTRVELKNMNSFSAIKRAIECEQARQTELLEQGQQVQQQTRRWDDTAKTSIVMRSKEDALDYRYFPEPDMPPLVVDEKVMAQVDEHEAVIPYALIKTMKQEYGFHKEYINALIQDQTTLQYFLDLVAEGFEPKLVAKWLAGPIAAYCKEHYVSIQRLPFDETEFREFLQEAKKAKLLDNQLKIVMQEMLSTDKSLAAIIKEKGFDAPVVQTDELENIIQEVLNANDPIVQQYIGGKESTIGFFLGQVMRATKGKANPKELQPLIKQALESRR